MASPKWFERDLVGDTSAHENSGWLWLAVSGKAAISRPGALLAAGMAVLVAALVGMPSVLVGVPVIFTLLFAGTFLDGKTRQMALRRARALPIELPPLTTFSDPKARILLERLARSREAIREVLEATPRGGSFDLEPALTRVPQLERQIVVIAARVEYVARFVATTAVSCLRADGERLRERARERDGKVRESLQRAAELSRSHFESVLMLQAEGERLLGMGEEALATLEQLPAMITSVQLRRFEACDGNGEGQLTEATCDLVEGLRALDQTLREPLAS
ncbi:MAG TPA: hypothetical protein VMT47_00275 [Polyangia bacterium]|nr:hypothetical protein [Polyangia bacterium]